MSGKLLFTIIILLIAPQCFSQNEPFTMRVVNTGYQLNSAWEITWGPDDSIWVTENYDYKVSRIDPNDGGKTELIDLSNKKNFTNPSKWPQGGLMGMALHPSMYEEWPNPSKPYIYLAYVYDYNGCGSGPCYFKTRVVRYTYDRAGHSLSNPQTLIQTLNGSNDHNSGRMTIGKIGGVPYLFYTIGDMGAGQFNNINRTNNAQSQNVLEGKILRFNLESDGDAGADKWIPDDNPFTDGSGDVTPVWSWGHRNAQGIVMSNDGILYSSEQQDKSDDEINIISKGRNYGWPRVCGYCDGNYDGLKLANQTVVSELTNCTNLNVNEPIYTVFTSEDPASLTGGWLTWPTIAASSIEVYEQNVIPNWNRSLLIPSLKAGLIVRLKLDSTGLVVTDSSTIPAMRHQGRYRDLCISPDGKKIYVACDLSGTTSGPSGGFNGGGAPPPHAGRILEFAYTGAVMALDTSSGYVYERNAQIAVYPNPASKIILVKGVKNVTNPLHYAIYNAMGARILSGKSNTDNFQINIASIPRGVYFLKVYNAYFMEIASKKIVVQ